MTKDKKVQVDFDFWDGFCLCRLAGRRRSVVYVHGLVDNWSRWEPEQQCLHDGVEVMQDKEQVDFDFWDGFCLCRLAGRRRSVVYVHGLVDNRSRWEPEQQCLHDGVEVMQDKEQVDFDFWDGFCLCRLAGRRRSVAYVHGLVDNRSRWEPE